MRCSSPVAKPWNATTIICRSIPARVMRNYPPNVRNPIIMMPVRRALIPALIAGATLISGCSGSSSPGTSQGTPRTTPSTAAASPAHNTDQATSDVVPILHVGKTVHLGYVTGDQAASGAEPVEQTSWTLTSVHYISYATAMKGGQYNDVPSNLGSNSLLPGQRFLVLGLTIKDLGPSGFSNNFPIGNATFVVATSKAAVGATDDYCMGQAPPGDSQYGVQYISQICSTNTVEPGQSVTGYVFFAVPDGKTALYVAGNSGSQDSKPVLIIDPDNMTSNQTCHVGVKTC